MTTDTDSDMGGCVDIEYLKKFLFHIKKYIIILFNVSSAICGTKLNDIV